MQARACQKKRQDLGLPLNIPVCLNIYINFILVELD